MFSAIIPLIVLGCLLVGLILIILGRRGRPRWSTPTCAKCRYDLRWVNPDEQRECPECGANLHAANAVHFGRHERSTRMFVAGLVVLLVPVLFFGNILLQNVLGFQWSQLRSNASVIAHLAVDADCPMTWGELTNRYHDGRLEDEDVASAIEQVIAYIQAGGSVQAHSSSRQFIELAIVQQRISDEQIAKLCEGYYANTLDVTAPPRARSGASVDIQINGTFWELPGFTQLYALREITLDGKAQTLQPRFARMNLETSGTGPMGIHAQVQLDAEPGDHELVFTLEHAVVESGRASMRPGPPEGWPEAVIRDVITVRWPIEILAADASPIRLVTPERHRQAVIDSLRVTALRFSGVHGHPELVMHPQRPPVPLSFKITIRSGEFEQSLGQMTAKDGGFGRGGSMSNIQRLPADATTVDVIFTPDPQAVETRSDWSEIWGDEIVIRNVPIVGRLKGADALRASLNINAVRLGRTGRQGITAAQILHRHSGQSPRDMSMRIIVRSGDFEREIGTLTLQGASSRLSAPRESLDGLPQTVSTVDVILQPQPTGRDDDDQWAEPIIYRNVPLLRDSQ